MQIKWGAIRSNLKKIEETAKYLDQFSKSKHSPMGEIIHAVESIREEIPKEEDVKINSDVEDFIIFVKDRQHQYKALGDTISMLQDFCEEMGKYSSNPNAKDNINLVDKAIASLHGERLKIQGDFKFNKRG